MQRWLIFFSLIIFLVSTQAVQAQDDLVFDTFLVDIWPEYDNPGVLVIYRVTLSEGSTIPAKMILKIPSRAGKPFNVAMKDVDGMLYSLEYTTSAENDWTIINFISPSPDIQVEYYDPGLNLDQDTRSFEYVWPGDYPVNNFSVRIQQPVNASNMEIKPGMGGGALTQDGSVYYNTLLGAKKEGETFSVSFSYKKTDQVLSSDLTPVQAVQPEGSQFMESRPFAAILPWILAGIGFLLIGGGAFWYWRTGLAAKARPDGSQRHKRSRESQGNSLGAEPLSGLDPIFCTQCGKRAVSGDQFCRSCGTSLRK